MPSSTNGCGEIENAANGCHGCRLSGKPSGRPCGRIEECKTDAARLSGRSGAVAACPINLSWRECETARNIFNGHVSQTQERPRLSKAMQRTRPCYRARRYNTLYSKGEQLRTSANSEHAKNPIKSTLSYTPLHPHTRAEFHFYELRGLFLTAVTSFRRQSESLHASLRPVEHRSGRHTHLVESRTNILPWTFQRPWMFQTRDG